jgi:tetratricopeptide (TPR) repeat protein
MNRKQRRAAAAAVPTGRKVAPPPAAVPSVLAPSVLTVEQAFDLARRHHQEGRLGEAESLYREILRVQPDHADSICSLGILAHLVEKFDLAADLIAAAIDLNPQVSGWHNDHGSALQALGLKDAAIAAYRRALTLDPSLAATHFNLGSLYEAQGHTGEARRAFEQCLRLAPDFAAAHLSLGELLLQAGDFRRGWEQYEWRYRLPQTAPLVPQLRRPAWQGEPLTGRTILLYVEQGYGDSIQFARYIPLVAGLGARVLLGCSPPLLRLFRDIPGVAGIYTDWAEIPDFDLHCPLSGLPRLFGTDLAGIPADIPYFRPDPERLAVWRERLAGADGLKVGLVWGGRPEHPNDAERSLRLAQLAVLGKLLGVRLFSLQYGPRRAELAEARPDFGITDLGPDLGDFHETAAAVAALDLIITVDTAMAHLAGALGCPVWLLLSFRPDWRWLLDRDDSPWYPTMRLFRQDATVGWEPVVARLAAALTTEAAG